MLRLALAVLSASLCGVRTYGTSNTRGSNTLNADETVTDRGQDDVLSVQSCASSIMNTPPFRCTFPSLLLSVLPPYLAHRVLSPTLAQPFVVPRQNWSATLNLTLVHTGITAEQHQRLSASVALAAHSDHHLHPFFPDMNPVLFPSNIREEWKQAHQGEAKTNTAMWNGNQLTSVVLVVFFFAVAVLLLVERFAAKRVMAALHTALVDHKTGSTDDDEAQAQKEAVRSTDESSPLCLRVFLVTLCGVSNCTASRLEPSHHRYAAA